MGMGGRMGGGGMGPGMGGGMGGPPHGGMSGGMGGPPRGGMGGRGPAPAPAPPVPDEDYNFEEVGAWLAQAEQQLGGSGADHQQRCLAGGSCILRAHQAAVAVVCRKSSFCCWM